MKTKEVVKYRPDIDGLRALAVTLVVLFHAFPSAFPAGFIGVDIFFVISGYLITSILLQDIENNQFSLARFYSRRIRRIFPALITVLFTVLCLGWFLLLPDEYAQLGKHALGGTTFISNFVLLSEKGYFDASSQLKPLLHLWSLAIEEQYYLFFPLILWLSKKYLRLLPVIIVLLLLSFIDNLYLMGCSANSINFYSPLSRIWELLLGAVLSIISLHKENAKILINLKRCEVTSTILSLFGIILYVVSFLLIEKETMWPGWQALFPVLGTILILVAGPQNYINKYLFSNNVIVFIGLISYPLYLWHWPLFSLAHIVRGGDQQQIQLLIQILLFLALFLATFTYYYVEKPIRTGKFNKQVVYLIVFMVGIAAAATCIYESGGIEGRSTIKAYLSFNDDLKAVKQSMLRNSEINGYYQPAEDLKIPWGELSESEWYQYLYKDAKSEVTYAIVGNSFGRHAFWGLADAFYKRGINTLYIGGWHERYKNIIPGYIDDNRVNLYAEKIADMIVNDSKIAKVFIITRFYVDDKITSDKKFINAINYFTHILKSKGKEVIIVEQNPILKDDIRKYIDRPLTHNIKLQLHRADIEYDYSKLHNLYDNISNAYFLMTIDFWCPNASCRIYDEALNGITYYVDNSHLGILGSKRQAEFIIENIEF